MKVEGVTGSVTEPTSNVVVRAESKEHVPCAAVHPMPCVQPAVMRWYGQPYCVAHAPSRPHRNSMYAWVRL